MKIIKIFVPFFICIITSYGQNSNNQRFIGEYYQGGIIFHIWLDSIGIQHGLIMAPLWIEPVSLERIDSKGYLIPGSNRVKLGEYEVQSYYDVFEDLMNWSSVSNKRVNTGKMSSNGKENTEQIIMQKGHMYSAAKACKDFKLGGYDDWYLPSLEECIFFFQNRDIVNFSLSEIESNTDFINMVNRYYNSYFKNRERWIGEYYYFTSDYLGYNRTTDINNGDSRWFWTSTEYDEEKSYAVRYSTGSISIEYKNGKKRGVNKKFIRPIRSF